MALKLNREPKDEKVSSSFVYPETRLYLTREGTLVNAGDPKAYQLYCTEHDEVSRADFERRLAATRGKKQKKSDSGEENKSDSGEENKSQSGQSQNK